MESSPGVDAVISPVPAAAWDEVLVEDPGATAHQTRPWLEAVLRATGGQDASRLYLLEDGRRLVLPLVRRHPAPGVALDGSYPAGYNAGGLLASGGLQRTDVRLVLDDLRGTGAVTTRLAGHHHTSEQWRADDVPGVIQHAGRTEVLDLDGGFPTVWDHRFRSSARRAVRKAERSRLEIERDSSPRLVPVYYDLYLRWTERRAQESRLPPRLARFLAARREPRRKFEAVTDLLGDRCTVWVASLDGEPVASIITLVHGRHASYWRGHSHKELAGPTRANVLLQRLAIEDACEAGCRFYDMGQSGGVTALEHYKQTLGAEPRPLVELRLERLPITALNQRRTRLQERVAAVLASRGADGA